MKAKEFIPAGKPRNFVAKNAPTSGAGRHKDSSKKKDQEQGKVKHKKDLVPMEDQNVAEVSKATIDRYMSKAVDAHGHADFAARQSKNDPSKRSYHVDQKKTAEKRRQGISRALDRMSKEGVAEGRHGYDDAGFSLAPGHDEGEPVYNPRYDRTGSYDRKAKYSQDYNYRTGKPLGSEPKKKGFVFYNVNDPQTAEKIGLKQTKSGKWYLPADDLRQGTADKVFGKGRYWEPKN